MASGFSRVDTGGGLARDATRVVGEFKGEAKGEDRGDRGDWREGMTKGERPYFLCNSATCSSNNLFCCRIRRCSACSDWTCFSSIVTATIKLFFLRLAGTTDFFLFVPSPIFPDLSCSACGNESSSSSSVFTLASALSSSNLRCRLRRP